MTLSPFARLALAIAFAPAAGGALAASPDEDWARFGRDVDPNTFLVGHPASPRWVVRTRTTSTRPWSSPAGRRKAARRSTRTPSSCSRPRR